jgi:hypothetical protein
MAVPAPDIEKALAQQEVPGGILRIVPLQCLC